MTLRPHGFSFILENVLAENFTKNGIFKCNLYFNRECVQCRVFNKGEKKDTCAQECMHFNFTKVDSRDKLPQPGQFSQMSHCKEKDIDDCWFYFTYSVHGHKENMVYVVETPGRKESDCVKIPYFFFYALFLQFRLSDSFTDILN